MKQMKNFHPLVSFLYFLFVIGYSMFILNPHYVIISFLLSLTYSLMIKGKKSIKTLIYFLPMALFMLIINPLVNTSGETVLFHLAEGRPITKEAILFGALSAVMIICVILWFSSFNEIIDDDKINYLFGKITPSFALIFCMTLKFIPSFIRHLKKVLRAQKGIKNQKSFTQKLKTSLSVFSATITWAFENAIETSDSMRARGYGLFKRTNYSIYKFTKNDALVLFLILIFAGFIFIENFINSASMVFFPKIIYPSYDLSGIISFVFYFLLILIPSISEIWEVLKWKLLKSKI